MILRKPYAFFIKYFRIINLVIALLMLALLYQTYVLFNLFNTYVSDYSIIESGFETGDYINIYSFIIPLIIILGNIVVLSVLFIKKKNTKLYLLNVIVYLVTIIIFALDYSNIQTAITAILDVRVSKAMRDLTLFVLIFQIVCLILTSIRAIGFDIKSFDFKKDLEELNITEKDNEEFEVNVNFDSNKTRRNVRRKLRHLNYFYKENKFFINLSVILLAVIVCFMVFINKTIYVSNYNENEVFAASNYNFNIENAYIITNDNNGNTIRVGKAFVAVKFKVSSYSKDTLNTGLITLKVGDKSYSKNDKYSSFDDIGNVYIDEEITKDFNEYVLVYMVPLDDIKKSMSIKINDDVSYVRGEMGAKNIFVKLKPVNLSKNVTSTEYNLGEKINFKGSLLGESTLNIKSMNFSNKFKEEYQFCSKTCINSYEYITPTATGDYEKALVQIDGTFNKKVNLPNLENLYRFINSYATFEYEINGKWYSDKVDSEYIKPKVAKTKYTYVEVNNKILNATHIKLIINVRNYSYKYIVK